MRAVQWMLAAACLGLAGPASAGCPKEKTDRFTGETRLDGKASIGLKTPKGIYTRVIRMARVGDVTTLDLPILREGHHPIAIAAGTPVLVALDGGGPLELSLVKDATPEADTAGTTIQTIWTLTVRLESADLARLGAEAITGWRAGTDASFSYELKSYKKLVSLAPCFQ